jgi:hypothetical protein
MVDNRDAAQLYGQIKTMMLKHPGLPITKAADLVEEQRKASMNGKHQES